ncbi:MAG TPA: hypothetical protein HPP83_13310, partial [Candidatus Hydrogenedentes bacterium]|nr:hypothetical protein [Candidatus Hydrogenedentota bacterium]
VAAACAFAAYAASADEDLLEIVIEQQEASRHKIKSLVATIELESSSYGVRDGELHKVTHKQIIHRVDKGSKQRWDTQTTSWQNTPWGAATPDGEGMYVGCSTRHQVINEAYLSLWEEGDWLYLYEHESIETMSDRAKIKLDLAEIQDILDFAVGAFNAQSFRDILEVSGDYSFSAERVVEDGDEVIQIKQYRGQSTSPTIVYTVDPDKGFLTTKMVMSSEHNGVFRDDKYSVDVQEVAPGIWFPMKVSFDSERHASDPNVSSNGWAIDIRVTSIEVNVPIEDDFFTWQATGYPENRRVFVVTLDEQAGRDVSRDYEFDRMIEDSKRDLDQVLAKKTLPGQVDQKPRQDNPAPTTADPVKSASPTTAVVGIAAVLLLAAGSIWLIRRH